MAADASLAFHKVGGPLVAVCGLVGGAGTTTLAYRLARRAAHNSGAPVLVAELQEQAGLAALAGRSGPLALRELARALDAQRPPVPPFVELEGGLRMVASAIPAQSEPASTDALRRVLADARAAHGLVVVDAGVVGLSDHTVLLRAASQVLFTLPATAVALQRAELLATAGMLEAHGAEAAALVAIATQPGRSSELKRIRQLAERHLDRLVLMPHIPRLPDGDHRDDTPLRDTFSALHTLLRKTQ